MAAEENAFVHRHTHKFTQVRVKLTWKLWGRSQVTPADSSGNSGSGRTVPAISRPVAA
jgi:hypothetical protein